MMKKITDLVLKLNLNEMLLTGCYLNQVAILGAIFNTVTLATYYITDKIASESFKIFGCRINVCRQRELNLLPEVIAQILTPTLQAISEKS